ncbi:MAG: OsmC family protein [Candidatus Algichlamydia australiensis]|nr:OsmC family protein [Chlamydiales bacterium]
MIEYPMKFKAEAKLNGGWTATAHGQPSLTCDVPEAFGGAGAGYSPEDLIGLSVMTCFMGTFKVFAEKSGLSFSDLSGNVEIFLDRNEEKVVSVTEVHLHFSLTGVTDEEKAHALLTDAQKSCIVANSLKSKNNFTFTIN